MLTNDHPLRCNLGESEEVIMMFKRGRVVLTPDMKRPYKVVLDHNYGGTWEFPVTTIPEGEALIRKKLSTTPEDRYGSLEGDSLPKQALGFRTTADEYVMFVGGDAVRVNECDPPIKARALPVCHHLFGRMEPVQELPASLVKDSTAPWSKTRLGAMTADLGA